MNMPIESKLWRKCAELKSLLVVGVCGANVLRYSFPVGYLTSGIFEQTKRGIKCTKAQYSRQSSQFSDYPHVTARWWISAQSIAQPLARVLAQSVHCWWTAIPLRALLLVASLAALLAQRPAKTNSFGNKLSVGRFIRSTLETLYLSNSPLLSPPRIGVRGFFSCLHASAHDCTAHSEIPRSIKGVAYV